MVTTFSIVKFEISTLVALSLISIIYSAVIPLNLVSPFISTLYHLMKLIMLKTAKGSLWLLKRFTEFPASSVVIVFQVGGIQLAVAQASLKSENWF
jgi:hypothetical protein